MMRFAPATLILTFLVVTGCESGHVDTSANTADTRSGGVRSYGEGSATTGNRTGESGQASLDRSNSLGGR